MLFNRFNFKAPSSSLLVDVTAPTVAITSTESSPSTADPIPITITFSENVTGFAVGDLTLAGCTAGNFVAVSGSVYTCDLTPTATYNGDITVDIAQGVCQDGAGNPNDAASQFAITWFSASLKAYWKLDEASDGSTPVTRVDSFSSSDLTDNNTTPSTTGQVGNAANFTSANSEYLSIASNTAVQAGSNASFLIDCYVKLTTKPGSGVACIVGKWNGTGGTREYLLSYDKSVDRFAFWVSKDGTATWEVTSKVVNADALGSPSTGVWYHIQAWWDYLFGTLNIRVNGGTTNTVAWTGGIFNSTSVFGIGGYVSGGSPTGFQNGAVDEVILSTQVPTIYNYDVFPIVGQSNAVGFGTNNQTYTDSLPSKLFSNAYTYVAITDPVDSSAGQVDAVSADATAGGSPWPLVANSMVAVTGRPVLFIPCAKADTNITEWLPGADHFDRTTLYGSFTYRTRQVMQQISGATARCVIWHQGERNCRDDIHTDEATYNGYLDTLADAVYSDLGIKLMPCKLQHMTDANHTVQAYQDAINNAIATAWADNPHVLQGPDFTDITPSVDGLHFKTDTELSTAASRWWTAIQTAFGW